MKIKSPEPGDIISVRTVRERIEGVLLESHEIGILLVKLKSGYNVGIKKEDVVEIDIVKKAKKEKKGKEVVVVKKKLKNVDMIITGGTISSRLDPKTGGVKWLTEPSELLRFYPELTEIVNIRKIHVPFMLASENMTAREWKEIAKVAEKSLNDKDCEGVIITHGTDFLHYTSAALSFFLRNLNKPVVLTYSQRSSDRASSDARLNLVCAARAAVSDIAEVMIIGHADTNDNFCYVLPGTKVRKMHTSRRDAFKVINDKPLAKVWPDRKEIEKLRGCKERNNAKKVKLDISFNDKIALVKFYPGMSPDILNYYAENYDGIVIEVSGLGHLPTSEARHSWTAKLKVVIEQGLVVCGAPQTLYGRLNPYVYSAGRELVKAGVIFLEDMLPETAFVKLGYILGHSAWKMKIKEKMLENISGEINKRIEKKEFI